MKEETMHRIRDETRDWSSKLPDSIGSFKLSGAVADIADIFEIFRYESAARHCAIVGCYDEATKEYKIRVRIGLNERSLTNFFAEDFLNFTGHCNVEKLVRQFDSETSAPNLFVEKLNLPQWEYGANLPSEISTFELFIRPSQPVEFTNGSSIIINYVDFDRERDLAIFYNIFSDEFGGEARTDGHTIVLYDFDAKTLPELEERLTAELDNCLQRLHFD